MEPRDLFGVGVRLMGIALLVAAAFSAIGLLISLFAFFYVATFLTAGSVLFFAAESLVDTAYGIQQTSEELVEEA